MLRLFIMYLITFLPMSNNTANRGTPMTIPIIPHKPPKNNIANSAQNVDKPVALPMHLGPIIFPSICCRIIINIMKYSDFIGDALKIIIVPGIAPMNGPTTGIILVIPTMT